MIFKKFVYQEWIEPMTQKNVDQKCIVSMILKKLVDQYGSD